jgi:hypothetical protein
MIIHLGFEKSETLYEIVDLETTSSTQKNYRSAAFENVYIWHLNCFRFLPFSSFNRSHLGSSTTASYKASLTAWKKVDIPTEQRSCARLDRPHHVMIISQSSTSSPLLHSSVTLNTSQLKGIVAFDMLDVRLL